MTFQTRLLAESSLHGDILQADFLDSYHNLTLKSVAMLRWFSTICTFSRGSSTPHRYLLKTDDDMSSPSASSSSSSSSYSSLYTF